MKIYTKQELAQMLNGIRSDLHEPYHEIGGKKVFVPTIEAMQIAIDRVFDAFGIDPDNQPEDEIAQLKQRIEKLERERAYAPMPYPVYPANPIPTYPLPFSHEYKITCSGGTIVNVESLNENS